MSRSLEKDLHISLQKEEAQKVYTSLVQEICKPRASLLEIEFLGKSHPLPPGQDFLLEESNIAIPKSKLVQAFTIARPILFKYNEKCQRKELGKEEETELLNATAIILLMDPEHLTAANTRKRLLKFRISQTKLDNSNLEIRDLITSELQFINSLLTSRLHRHTKSPTLWSHRRYILSLLPFQAKTHSNSPPLSHGPPYDILADFQTIILISASRHPKNYYAWSHARWLLSTFSTFSSNFSPDENPLIPRIQNWVLRNPSDTSGFSFLYFLLSSPEATRADVTRVDVTRADASGAEARREVYRTVFNLAVSFKWTYGSVWVFLRTLAAFDEGIYRDRDSDGDGGGFEREVGELVRKCEGEGKGDEGDVLRGAVSWYREEVGR